MEFPPPITSRTNARVKLLRAALSGKASAPGELVGVEGETLVIELAERGERLDSVFVRKGSERLMEHPVFAGLKIEQVGVLNGDVFDSVMTTVTPQGIVAMMKIPAPKATAENHARGILLILEDVQDPGNLGTLMRSAEAFGVARVYMTHGSVNPWNSKVIRASAGSVFRVPATRATMQEIRRTLVTSETRLIAAVADPAGATAIMATPLTGPLALLIGNEGAGLSKLALSLADERVFIPCATESLNAAVAGSVLLYETMRQRMAEPEPR